MESAVTRLNKFLSEAGYCSRRAADKLIEEGRVTVNGKHPEMGTKVSSTDEVSVDGKVVSIKKKSRVYILLTDDGDIVNKILRSSNNHEKEYIVRVDKPISQTFVKRMSEGVPILDTMTKPCRVQKLSRDSFKIVLTQGLNRQIRRMCSYLDYEVESLKRVRIMNINLMSDVGEYRNLTKEELNTLNKALKSSKKTW